MVAFAIGLAMIIDSLYRSSLESRATTFAAVVPSERVSAAIDPANSSPASDFYYLKAKVIDALNANPDARYLYIAAMDRNNTNFMVDSDPQQKDPQQGVPKTLAYFAALNTGTVSAVGPISYNGLGTLSAYAPLRDRENGHIIGVVGIDVPSSTYFSLMTVAIILPLIGAGLLSGIFITGDRIRARRREALRFRSELVSIASHELRTPLTGIRWGEESLLNAKLSDHDRDTMHTMYDSTLRLQESIEDILQLANWQAGRYDQLDIKPTDMTHIVTGIFATQKLPAAQKGMTLEFAHEWPHRLMINCDEQRMKRVLNNLVSNAIKYGRPNTAVTLDYEKVDGHHLISIKDHGIGIPEEEKDKVFKGFYRASNAVKHEAGGTGMGLYMSRTVIERHGGKLWLKSKENKGTTVYIKLPR